MYGTGTQQNKGQVLMCGMQQDGEGENNGEQKVQAGTVPNGWKPMESIQAYLIIENLACIEFGGFWVWSKTACASLSNSRVN